MHLPRMNIFKYLIIITAIFLCSCGASHNIVEEIIYKDDGFSYNHMKKNDVAIGGITSQQLTFTDDVRIQYSSLFSTVLLENLKDVHSINIVNTSQLMQKIGRENYFNIMKEFDVEQTLIDEAMGFIKESIPEVEYLIIANIDNENIVDRSHRERIKDEKGEEKYETDYERTYYLTVEFHVYDLFQEEMIWNILMYNRAEKTETRTTETGCFESCITGAIQDILFGSPAEIDREEVLAEIYKDFADKLAKQ
ncbi:hypothetical protein ACFLS9_00550 [Bacteroidota bacterium]